MFQLMYYANTVYSVERTRLTTHLMIFSMRTWAIVRNPPPFNNTPVLADPVYYNRCIKPSWELSIKKHILLHYKITCASYQKKTNTTPLYNTSDCIYLYKWQNGGDKLLSSSSLFWSILFEIKDILLIHSAGVL